MTNSYRKSDLIHDFEKKFPHLEKEDSTRIVNLLFDTLSAALADGERIELRGFGTFSVKKRNARMARNPKTGDAVKVDDKFSISFKCGKELKTALNTSS